MAIARRPGQAVSSEQVVAFPAPLRHHDPMIAVVRIRDGCTMGWYQDLKRAERALLAFGEGFFLEEREAPEDVKWEIRRLERL